MPMPFDFNKIDIDKLSEEAQKNVMLLALMEEDYVNGDKMF